MDSNGVSGDANIRIRDRLRYAITLTAVFQTSGERPYPQHESARRGLSGCVVGWCDKYGMGFAHRVKAVRRKPGSMRHLDEMFITLRGGPCLLWRAVDEHDAELDILVQKSTAISCAT